MSIIDQYGQNEIADLIKIVRERFIPDSNNYDYWLRGIIEPKNDKPTLDKFRHNEPLSDEVLIEHFSGNPRYVHAIGNRIVIWGSVSVYAYQNTDETVKFIGVDADNTKEKLRIEKQLLPWFNKNNIDYLYEVAGSQLDKSHTWVFLDNCPQKLAQRLMDFAMQSCGLGDWRKEHADLELFGSHRPLNKLRLPLGTHLKRLMQICQETGIDFRDEEAFRKNFTPGDTVCPFYKNNNDLSRKSWSWDLRIFRKTLEEIKPLKRKFIKNLLPEDDSAKRVYTSGGIEILQDELAIEHRKLKVEPITDPDTLEGVYYRRDEFTYRPNGEPLNTERELPPFVNAVVTHCPAFRALFESITEEKMLDDSGGTIHDAGLYVANLFVAGQYRSGSWGAGCLEAGEQFFDQHRFRPWESHQWFRDMGFEERMRLVPRCETMDRSFDLCGDCKFREVPNFTNPSHLYVDPKYKKGGVLRAKLVKKLGRAQTNEAMKEHMIAAHKEAINDGLRDNLKTLVVNEYGQGVGKSRGADEMIADYARRGKKQIISVMSGQLAQEHKENLEGRGIRVHILGSRKTIFEHIEKRFHCPNAEEIDYYSDICMSRESIRREFCRTCPYADMCAFPEQQEQERIDSAQVIIVQHAHLRIPTIMNKLLQDHRFHIIWYDEDIVGNLQGQRKIEGYKLRLLKHLASKDVAFSSTAKCLLRWIKSNARWREPTLLPIPDQEKIKLGDLLKQWGAPVDLRWLIELIQSLNAGHIYAEKFGAHYFYTPVPFDKVPVQVVLDATAQCEVLRDIFDTEAKDVAVVRVGKDQYTDIREYHPDNKIIKILGTSTSKTKLANLVYYDKLLTYICELMYTKHAEQTAIITVFKDHVPAVEKWLAQNAPDLLARVSVNWMQPGTNKYRETQVQFLLASVHLTHEQIALQVWQRKNIRNFWRLRDNKQALLNPFDYTEGTMTRPRRLRLMSKTSNKVILAEFPTYRQSVPNDVDRRTAYSSAVGKTQQGIRIRFYAGQKEAHTVYDFTGHDFPGFAYTDVIPASEILGLRPQTGGLWT